MCCSNNIYGGFCQFSTCDTFKIADDVVVGTGQEGDWILQFDWLGAEYKIIAGLIEGDIIQFPLSGLNEACEVVAAIIKPSGDIFTFTIEAVEYDAFILKTKLIYQL